MKKRTGYDPIATSIKNFRTSNNFTLSELATRLNTSQGYLSEIENSVTKPGFALLLNLRKEFQVDINALLDSTYDNINNINPQLNFKIHLETKAFEEIIETCNNSLKKLSVPKPLTFWQKILKAIKKIN